MKIKKNYKEWHIIPNEYLKDKRLKLKEIGLLTKLYALPDNWDFNMKGLQTITNEKITALRNAMANIELYGYITRYQVKNEKGQFEYIYKIYDEPQKINLENSTKLRRFKEQLHIQ